MISLDDIKRSREELIEIARRYRASNLRVFGSVARGENQQHSDIDLLVYFQPGASLLDQVGLTDELSDFFGCHVDVVSDRALNKYLVSSVIRDAREI